jgi:hypothetical protein
VVQGPDDELRLPAHEAFAADGFAQFPNPAPTTVEGLIAQLNTHSWALTADPGEREATFERVRAYLAGRPETATGAFDLPIVTDVVRLVRRERVPSSTA